MSKTHINFKIFKIWPFLKVEKDAESVAVFFFFLLFFKNHHPPIYLVWDYYSRSKWPWELSYFKSLGERGGGIGNRRIIQLFGHSVREGAPPRFSRNWGVPAAHAQGIGFFLRGPPGAQIRGLPQKFGVSPFGGPLENFGGPLSN